MPETYRVAIMGATGAVGTELLTLLEERDFPVKDLVLLASPRSAGKKLAFKGQPIVVQDVSKINLADIDLVLASAGGAVSKEWAPKAADVGAVVVDNSNAFRMAPDVPLVVPEVNPEAVLNHKGIIANPNCTTILMSLVLWPLHSYQSIKRVVVSTYQSASGAGARAMEEVKLQAQSILGGEQPVTDVFPYPLAFNLFPHNSPLNDQGYCQEEMKMVNETRKIFGVADLRISATCVRVPVLRAHSEAINIEFTEPLMVAKALELLKAAPGVTVVEDWQANYFPMPIEASGQDAVLVGRIRADISHDNGLELWLSGDQIRKGAALNAIQIAELLVRKQALKQKSLV
ncbi:MAG: aspartate-semialdehyde dehydrogenase [Cyanobacteria bacterium P01_D01_bin.156]